MPSAVEPHSSWRGSYGVLEGRKVIGRSTGSLDGVNDAAEVLRRVAAGSFRARHRRALLCQTQPERRRCARRGGWVEACGRARGVADDRTEGTVAVRRDDGGEIFALGAGGVRIGDERVRGTSALESLVGV